MPGKRNRKTLGTGELNQFLEVCKFLNTTGARYLVVGGIAAFLHGYSRTTKDLDIFIPRDTENAQLIIDALTELPLALAKEFTGEEIIKKVFTIIGDMPRVNIITGGMRAKFDELFEKRAETTINGVKIPFISLDDLIFLKQHSSRPRDKLDAKELIKAKRLSKRPT